MRLIWPRPRLQLLRRAEAPIFIKSYPPQHHAATIDVTMDIPQSDYGHVPLKTLALPQLVEVLTRILPILVPDKLEAVRHLPVLSDGPLFSVRKHIRAAAMGRNVVIKVLKKSISPGSSDPATEQELRRLFKEVKILSSRAVALHDNIIDLESMEFGIHSGNPLEICPAIVLEYASLGSLDSFQKTRTLSWSVRKSLCYDIANGLDGLHSSGILHGDLHSSHVLIFNHPEREFIAKLTGFGDSEIIAELTSPPILGGEICLQAPEAQERSIRMDQILETDVFSLGLLLWSVFVNQDAFATFDLPLEPITRNKSIKNTLTQPYLFRFIPLLIEHEVGVIEERDLKLLQEIFECTVRISPRSRDLSKVLYLLHPHNLRQTKLEDNGTSSKVELITGVETGLRSIKASLPFLKDLPFMVATQYIKALDMFLEQRINPKLMESAAWTLFHCHLHGYGTDRSPSKALETLLRYCGTNSSRTEMAELLVLVFREALDLNLEVEEEGDELDSLVLPLERLCAGKLGPWMGSASQTTLNVEDHGLTVDHSTVIDLCKDVEAGNIVTEKNCGSSNTL
jgi:serine/threonine protein kinase